MFALPAASLGGITVVPIIRITTATIGVCENICMEIRAPSRENMFSGFLDRV